MKGTNHSVDLAALFISSTYQFYMVDIVELTNGETLFEDADPVFLNGIPTVRHVFWAVVVTWLPQAIQSQGQPNE